MYVCMYGHTYSKSKDRPGKVANPARGQLNRENEYFPIRVRAWEFGRARRVRQSRPASACSFPCSGWIWCLLTRFLPSSAVASIYSFKPPYAIGSAPSLLSGDVIAYRWRSLPRVRRHRASKPQGSSSNGCCLGRSPWTNSYAPLFPTPGIGMKWACWKYRRYDNIGEGGNIVCTIKTKYLREI